MKTITNWQPPNSLQTSPRRRRYNFRLAYVPIVLATPSHRAQQQQSSPTSSVRPSFVWQKRHSQPPRCSDQKTPTPTTARQSESRKKTWGFALTGALEGAGAGGESVFRPPHVSATKLEPFLARLREKSRSILQPVPEEPDLPSPHVFRPMQKPGSPARSRNRPLQLLRPARTAGDRDRVQRVSTAATTRRRRCCPFSNRLIKERISETRIDY